MKNTKKIIFDDFITSSGEMKNKIEQMKKVAVSDITVLLLGEPGTGKNILAHAMHNYSKRKDSVFVSLNCKTMDDEELEEALFGEKGKLQLAAEGTLFIDEIGAMSNKIQKKLLGVIEAKEAMAKGETPDLDVNARIIVSSSDELKDLLKENKLEQSLFFRLNEVSFKITPLKERKDDINLLIRYFLDEFNIEFNKQVSKLSNIAMSYLLNYDWPGNVRELRSMLRTAVAFSDKSTLWFEDIPFKITITNENLFDIHSARTFTLKQAEKDHVFKVLNMCKWNKSKTAKLLNISRPRLDRKIYEYRLKKPIKRA
jgi:transcriptional regulator with PAS, ATPase and Fis domain